MHVRGGGACTSKKGVRIVAGEGGTVGEGVCTIERGAQMADGRLRISTKRACTAGEGNTHNREGGCAWVMGRACTGGDGGAHDDSLYQF